MAIAIASGPAVLPINTVPTVRATITTVTGDTSYPTNGSPLTAAQLGLSAVSAAICTVAGSAANNIATGASYDTVNSKLKMWATTGTTPDTLTEAANAGNLSGLTITVLAFGV